MTYLPAISNGWPKTATGTQWCKRQQMKNTNTEKNTDATDGETTKEKWTQCPDIPDDVRTYGGIWAETHDNGIAK